MAHFLFTAFNQSNSPQRNKQTPYTRRVNERERMRKKLMDKYPDVYARFYKNKNSLELKKLLDGEAELPQYTGEKRVGKKKIIKAIKLMEPRIEKMIDGYLSGLSRDKIDRLFRFMRRGPEYRNVPDELCDPISLDIIGVPAKCDGIVFDRDIISAWLKDNGSNPFTRNPMSIDDLEEDEDMKTRILNFKSDYIKNNVIN